MTAERRLAKLEGALSPKAATLLWLEEAQQFPSLPAYVDWLIEQPISAAPLERVPAQARAAAVEALRGQPRAAVREAAHQAIRDAIFLVELVLRLNSVAEETVRIEGLRYAALFWEMRALAAEAELARGREHPDADHTIAERWQAWREGSTGLAAGSSSKRRPERSWSAATSRAPPPSFPISPRTGCGCASRPSDWPASAISSMSRPRRSMERAADGAERPADRRSTCTNSVPRPSRARPTRRRPWSTRLGLRPSIPLATPTVWQPSRNAGCAPNAVPESSWRSESHPRDSDASAWSPRMDSNRPRRP